MCVYIYIHTHIKSSHLFIKFFLIITKVKYEINTVLNVGQNLKTYLFVVSGRTEIKMKFTLNTK